jgi:hypothetical protein
MPYEPFPVAQHVDNFMRSTSQSGALSTLGITSFNPASPGVIGSTTPSVGFFTDITSNNQELFPLPITLTFGNILSPALSSGTYRQVTMTNTTTLSSPRGTPVDGGIWKGRFINSTGSSLQLSVSGIKIPRGFTWDPSIPTLNTRELILQYTPTVGWWLKSNLEIQH